MRYDHVPITLLVLLISISTAATASAAPPKVEYLFPPGCRRAEETTVQAKGKFDRWPVDVWVDRPGLSVRAADKESSFVVTSDPDARPGCYWLRFHDGQGASSLVPLLLGTLPETNEDEPNDRGDVNAAVDPPIVVNGRLGKNEDVDTTAIELRQGQLLVASMLANRLLGSPTDGVLQVCDEQGFVLTQNDDERGLDPLVVFSVPRDGVYLVRIFAFPVTPNSSIRFAGSDEMIYRLTLTTGAFLDHVQPMFLRAGQPNSVRLGGWNLPESLDRDLAPFDFDSGLLLAIEDAAGRVPVAESTSDVVIVDETADENAMPTQVNLPAYVSGCIESPGDEDVIEFRSTKDRSVRVRLESRSIGYPLDAVVEVEDASGKAIARSDDVKSNRDPELTFKVPADGPIRVRVLDLNGHGGQRYVYRLSVIESAPEFTAEVTGDAFVVAAGEQLKLPVVVRSEGGFEGSVTLTALDLPESLGRPTLELKVPKNKEVKGELIVSAGEDAATFSGPFRVAAVAGGDDRGFATCHRGPLGIEHRRAWLTVVGKSNE